METFEEGEGISAYVARGPASPFNTRSAFFPFFSSLSFIILLFNLFQTNALVARVCHISILHVPELSDMYRESVGIRMLR